jgi:hypothetical protein
MRLLLCPIAAAYNALSGDDETKSKVCPHESYLDGHLCDFADVVKVRRSSADVPEAILW